MKRSIVFVTLTLCAAATAADGPYIVGPDVQVSLAHSTIQHTETQISADPERAGHLIACGIMEGPEHATSNVFYVSNDGGATWKDTLTVPESVDPSCTIGIQGSAFASSIHDVTLPDGTTPSFLDVRRSADGGRTWRQSEVRVNTRSVDRAYITSDDSHGPFRSRVYVHAYLQRPRDADGTPLAAAFVVYPSSDQGRTFDRVLIHQAAEFAAPWFFPANGVVSATGEFTALFVELDNAKRNMSYRTDTDSAPKGIDGALFVVSSHDGGSTLGPARKITDACYDWRVPQLSMSSLAIDRTRGPFRGRLYSVWPAAGPPARRTQIFFSHSEDAGHSWSAPLVVSDDEAMISPDHPANNFMPMISVNKDGAVGICWYDRRDNPDNLGYWVRFSASRDGGATWLPSIRASTHANVVREAEHYAHLNGGDTAGLTADAEGVFHPLWIDNRTGVHQMWTTTIKLSDRPGGPRE